MAEPIMRSFGGPFLTPPPRVFAGRDAELAVLRDAWRAARAGAAQVVVLTAAPGFGKTSLLGRFLTQDAPERHVWVSGGEPLQEELPWQLLGHLAQGLSQWTGHVAGWADRDPLSNPAHAGLPLLDELQAAGPVAVVVDDVQWIDQESAAVLRFAARHLRGPVLLAVTCSDEYPVACDEWQRVFPPAPGSMLSLGGLAAQDLVDLAARLGYPGLSPAGAVRLRGHTDGNPLFATQVLGQVPLRAINSGHGPLPAPRRVTDTVAARLTARTEPARSFAAAAAVIGIEFSVALAAAIAGLTDVADLVDELTEATLIAEVPASEGRRFLFTHALVQRAVYERTPLGRRRMLHLTAAELTSGSAALRHRAAAAEGPDPVLAADLDAQAVEAAARGELAAAARYRREALDRSSPGPDRTRRLLTLVETLLIAGDAASAEAYRTEIAAGGGDPWWDYVAGYQALLSGDFPQARLRLTKTLGTLDAAAAAGVRLPGMPRDLRARAATHLAIMGLVMLDYPAMVQYGEVATTTASADPTVRAFAWFARTLGLALTGRGRQALGELAEIGPGNDLDLLAARGIVELWLDDLDAAIADLTEVVDRAYHGAPLRVAQAMAFLGDAEYRRGLLDESARHTEHAVWEATENLRYWDYALLHGFACQTQAARGDWAAAEEHARSAEETAELWAQWTGTGSVRLSAAGSRAVIAQAHGNPSALLTAAAQVDAVLDSPEPGITLLGPLRAEALVQLGDADAAERALADFAARFGAAQRTSTLMSITRVRGRIAACRGAPAAALAAYTTALELADSVGLPLEAGRIQLLMGDCLAGSGRPAGGGMRLRAGLRDFQRMGARAYAAQAEALIRQHRLPFDHAADPADPLTDLSAAQREVVTRIAAGLTSREVSQDLVVSAKNVEQHLSTIYRELGLTAHKRSELMRLVSGRA